MFPHSPRNAKQKANATQNCVAFCIFTGRQKLDFVRVGEMSKQRPGGPFAYCFAHGDRGKRRSIAAANPSHSFPGRRLMAPSYRDYGRGV